MDVRQNHATHGGEVVGCLLPQDNHSVSIGVIALEWGEWLPTLQFVPTQPSMVWIINKFWERFLKRLFPSVSFLNGSLSPLPPVDFFAFKQSYIGTMFDSVEHLSSIVNLIFLAPSSSYWLSSQLLADLSR